MNLGRIGHYFVPTGRKDGVPDGHCRTAIVIDCVPNLPDDQPQTANLAVFGAEYGTNFHADVPVEPPTEGHASFHLNAQCPWKR